MIGKLPGYKQAEMLLQTSVIIRLLEKEPKFSDTCLCVHSFRNVRFRKAAEGADPLPPGQRLRPASVYLAGERSTAFFPFPQSFDQRSCELAFAVGQMGLCDADHAYSFGSKKKMEALLSRHLQPSVSAEHACNVTTRAPSASVTQVANIHCMLITCQIL